MNVRFLCGSPIILANPGVLWLSSNISLVIDESDANTKQRAIYTTAKQGGLQYH